MSKLLIADDDPHIRELVKLALRSDGYEMVEAKDGVEALAIVHQGRVDIAIVDIMMPEKDGLHICREIKQYYDIPVLILTARGTSKDKITGFQSGTDDYMVKPFNPTELSYRIKALLRRFRMEKDYSVQIGHVYMNRDRIVRIGETTVTLPPKEFKLLYKLATHPNRTLTREQLIEQIWGIDFDGDERTLDVHVKRLRDRFSGLTDSFEIVTVRGLGYRLEAKHV